MTHPAKLAALALQQVASVLDKLTEEQLTALAEGRAHVEFRLNDTVVASARPRATSRSAASAKVDVDVEQIVKAIRELSTADEVSAYLDAHEKEFKLTDFKAVARALGPTVSATGGSKAVLKRNIVEGTAGFRQRSAAVFDRGW